MKIAFRESGEEQGLLQTVPGEVPSTTRREDRLLCQEAAGCSSEEQVQHTEVATDSEDHEQGHNLSDSFS